MQAQPGVPIEQGVTSATGTGKAEIEFEDQSVLYLADNSTLVFEELVTLDDAPSTLARIGQRHGDDRRAPAAQGGLQVETPSSDLVSLAYPSI